MRMPNATINCSIRQVAFRGGSVTAMISPVILPPILLIGIVGNLSTLLVFKGKRLATKSALMFSALAYSDLMFLLSTALVIGVGLLQTATGNPQLYFRYHWLHNAMTPFQNWFSTASIWLVLMISIERVFAVRRPLQSLAESASTLHIAANICWIAAGSLTLTFYQHFNNRITATSVCNGTRMLITFTQNTDTYFRFSVGLHVLLAVAIPLVALIVLNGILIHAVKHSMRAMGENSVCHDSRNSSESRITMLVCLMVGCFCLTNVPSACVYVYELIDNAPMGRGFYKLVHFTNLLVITGKVLNFFLFCASSTHFRNIVLEKLRNIMGVRCTNDTTPRGRSNTIDETLVQSLTSSARRQCSEAPTLMTPMVGPNGTTSPNSVNYNAIGEGVDGGIQLHVPAVSLQSSTPSPCSVADPFPILAEMGSSRL